MIDPKQIPEEVLRALCASMGCEWAMQDMEDQILVRRHIAAALAAWPDSILMPAELILPLTQEGGE